MKNNFILSLILLITLPSIAQVHEGKHDKLFDDFLMEKYDACLSRSMKMTEKDEYRKDPEPFLYIAMCNVKFTESEDAAELYPNALKDAIKYAAKAVKIDAKARNTKSEDRAESDDAGYYTDGNQEFLDELKALVLQQAEYYFYEDNFSKAASTYSKILKFSPNDENVFMITGAAQYLSKNIGQGKISIDQAVKLIKEKYKDDYYEGSDVSMLSMEMGVVAYCNYLIDSGDAAGANAFLKDIYDSLSWNDKIASYYKSVVK